LVVTVEIAGRTVEDVVTVATNGIRVVFVVTVVTNGISVVFVVTVAMTLSSCPNAGRIAITTCVGGFVTIAYRYVTPFVSAIGHRVVSHDSGEYALYDLFVTTRV
jgi:hypothetical protein